MKYLILLLLFVSGCAQYDIYEYVDIMTEREKERYIYELVYYGGDSVNTGQLMRITCKYELIPKNPGPVVPELACIRFTTPSAPASI